ncbi:MAG: hypothetical protein WAT81_04080 [Candidatus Moraniibacteriota bacterium]
MSETARLASLFRQLGESEENADAVFEDLESDLVAAGFERADAYDVVEILHNPAAMCRSESFTRVMELLLDKQELSIPNHDDDANMCHADGGAGFRVAMLEGFSGKDVHAATKVVLTFIGQHLAARPSINRDSSLWQTKPETARVSVRGRGSVTVEDVQMVSFRFPTKLFPREHLTEEEIDRYEEGRGDFVIRHFVASQNEKDYDRAMAS